MIAFGAPAEGDVGGGLRRNRATCASSASGLGRVEQSRHGGARGCVIVDGPVARAMVHRTIWDQSVQTAEITRARHGTDRATAPRRPRAVRPLPARLQAARGPARPVLRARARGRRRWCSPPTAAPPASASTRSRRSRSTISCPARRCSRSAPPAATSPASSARTGTSRSRARSTRWPSSASPGGDRRRAARQLGCRCVAFTYNDPVIFAEYAIDVAEACRDAGRQDGRRDRRLHLRRSRGASSTPHGRGQRRPEGLHRGASTTSSAPAELGRVLDTLDTSSTRRCLVRDHHAAHSRRERFASARSRRCPLDLRALWARTCRCTSPPSTPTTRCATSRGRRPRPSAAPATSRAQRPPARLCRQRPRPRGAQHLLPGCGERLIERTRYTIPTRDRSRRRVPAMRHRSARRVRGAPGHWGARRMPVRLGGFLSR